MNATAVAPRHSLFDDAQGLLTGTLFVAMARVLFCAAGLVTGSTAGLAFIAHDTPGLPFGLAFFVINVPFCALAWRRMGGRLTLKTFDAVAWSVPAAAALSFALALNYQPERCAAV